MDEPTPQIEVRLTNGPLPPAEPWSPPGAGAVLSFEGIVRPEEAGRTLAALDYEQYPPMTERELHKLAAETIERHGLIAMRVEHSEGRVPVGECSFRLGVTSEHRAEALIATAEFIDRMKRTVPLWKMPCYADRASTAEAATTPLPGSAAGPKSTEDAAEPHP